MNSKIVALVTLFALLFGCAYSDQSCSQAASGSASTIGLSVFGSSNQWWIAVAPQNAAYDVALVEVQEAGSSTYTSMLHDASWGYWQLASTSGNPTGFNLPLSFRLTATSGQQVVMNAILPTISAGSVVTSQVQFGSSTGATPTDAPTDAPDAPTDAPTNPEHGNGGSSHQASAAPTQAGRGNGHGHGATEAPTQAPSKGHGSATQAPTKKPTQAPTKNTPAPSKNTQAPSKNTQAPTKKPTQAPSKGSGTGSSSGSSSGSGSTDLCAVTSTSSEPLKFIIPLYVDPSDGSAWTDVASAGKTVPIIAIINPNSGPAKTAGSDYTSGMAKLAAAGVTMLGYVHTSYGARSIADVTADISTYAAQYPGLAGIFIDEAATSASEISYYTQVYNAIMSHSGYVNAILNPGTQPDQGYLAVSTNLVVFEDNASNLKSDFSSWVSCAPSAAEKAGYKYRFSGMAIAASQSNMPSLISTMANAGLGMVFVTDATLSGNTYGQLPTFFTQEVSQIAADN